MINHFDPKTVHSNSRAAGKSKLVIALWSFLGLPIAKSYVNPFPSLRQFLLRIFGANIEKTVSIGPGVRVKCPWRLTIGADTRIGEDCWIDNLEQVTIGKNVCLCPGAYLCTGDHEWWEPALGLILKPITICDGAWIGAMSMVGPGVVLGERAVASVGSVVMSSIPAYEVHAGAPARLIRTRKLRIREKHSDEELSWN
jgi:putative colanic acid biosynthesis acetyltransferase WcaF